MAKNSGILFLVLAVAFSYCEVPAHTNEKKHCGYPLTKSEYVNLQNKMTAQEYPYGADSTGNIYDQLNDSIRAAMPDSVEFEVFLTLLNDKEVGVDVAVPPNPAYYDKIGCAVMNANYSAKMPAQRYLLLYTYTNLDGSGDVPLEFVIKRKK